MLLFFFFQAEDGIRDIGVTGVQTCALPIFAVVVLAVTAWFWRVTRPVPGALEPLAGMSPRRFRRQTEDEREGDLHALHEIGRASCRERVEISVGGASLKKKKNISDRKYTIF